MWAYASFVGGRLLVLASMAVLARLLTPRQFGIVGFALTFLAFISMLKDLGLNQALVAYRGDDIEERAGTVFAASVGIGALMSLATVALAPLAADFFGQPRLVAIVPVLGLNFFVQAIGGTHYALAQRQLNFRSRAGAETADVLVRGATGTALALLGAGVWSLVLGYVVGSIVKTVGLWILVPWRPRGRLRRAHLQGMIGFGGTLAVVDIVSAMIGNVDYLFVGKILGAGALGLYTIGYRLPELIIMNLSVIAGVAMFPAFAQVKRSLLRHAYLVGFRYTIMVALPLTAGMLVLAKPMVLALFGAKWAPAAGPMRMLALFALAITVDIPAGTVYKATGRARILLALSIPKLVLLCTGLALFTHDGIVVAAACQTALAAGFLSVGICLVWRLLGVSPRMLWWEARPIVLSVAAMSAVILLLHYVIGSPWPTLAACLPAGAATYGLALWLLAPRAVADLLHKVAPGGLGNARVPRPRRASRPASDGVDRTADPVPSVMQGGRR